MSETQLTQALKGAYRWYYFKKTDELRPPSEIDKREFGYRDFNGNMVRHIQLKSKGELYALAVREVPRSIYYSVSYYKDPAAPMQLKGRMGSDLVFDIDMKDVSKSYEKHSFWICESCHAFGPGQAPGICPRCGSKQVKFIDWACDECINEIKNEAMNLIDILQGDFGINANEISVYFSGNNGFHVHVDSKKFISLSSKERAEIVDYIRGTGFESEIYLSNVPDRAKEYAIKRKRVLIDPQVTVDVSRIFRLPGSLHDESGLEKKLCRNIETCDPFTDAAVLPDEPLNVMVYYAPEFKLKGLKFGPYRMESAKLPTYAAVYLMAKGLAQPVI